MKNTEYDRHYQTVSVELSNPFPVLGQYSLNHLKQFYATTNKFLTTVFSKKEEALQGTLNFRQSPELEQSIIKKEVLYSDFRPLLVYVPSVLQPKVHLIALARQLYKDIDLVERIIDNAPKQLIALLDGYIGNPSCLQDASALHLTYAETIDDFTRLMDESKKSNAKIMTATGSKTQRTFQETYGRLEDYRETNRLTSEVYHRFQKIQPKVSALQIEVNKANDLINQLLLYVQTKPDTYKLSAPVAQRLTLQMKQLADLTAYVANTLYICQMLIKSVSDNIYILDRTLQK